MLEARIADDLSEDAGRAEADDLIARLERRLAAECILDAIDFFRALIRYRPLLTP